MKKRSLFMAVVLLMFGLNLEADNSTSNSEALLILNVPVNVHYIQGVPILGDTGVAAGGATGAYQYIHCLILDSQNKIVDSQRISIHNGQYTAQVVFPKSSYKLLAALNAGTPLHYKCAHSFRLFNTNNNKYSGWKWTADVYNKDAILESNAKLITQGSIE